MCQKSIESVRHADLSTRPDIIAHLAKKKNLTKFQIKIKARSGL